MTEEDFKKLLDNIEYKINFKIEIDEKTKDMFYAFESIMYDKMNTKYRSSIDTIRRHFGA